MSALEQAQVYLPSELMRELDELARREGVSRSEIIRAAVHAFVSPDGVDKPEAGLARRIDRMDRRLDVAVGLAVLLLQSLDLYVETWLAVAPTPPDGERPGVEARGVLRAREFRASVARRLVAGGSDMGRLLEIAAGLADELATSLNER